MNKVNWVDGRYTTPGDFNAMQTNPEDHFRSHAKAALAGHIDGLTPVGTAGGVQISPGVTWDDQGRRIMVPAATAVDMSAIQRPASGQYRWVNISISYRQVERSTVTDSGGVERPAYLDDSFALTATAGPEFAANDILAARFTSTGRPATPNGSVGIGTFIADHASGWPDLVSTIHRPSYIGSKAIFISSLDRAEIERLLSAIVPPTDPVSIERVRIYGWGMFYFTSPQTSANGPVLYVSRASSILIAVAVPPGSSLSTSGIYLHDITRPSTTIGLQAVFLP